MCGKHGESTCARGKAHECFGVTFEFENREAHASMTRHLNDMSKQFPVEFKDNNRETTPVGGNVFQEDHSAKSSTEEREVFHRTVAQALRASAVLCARVTEPGRNSWKKLAHMMKFTHGAVNDKLILQVEDFSTAEWFVDASFVVHPDFKSH